MQCAMALELRLLEQQLQIPAAPDKNLPHILCTSGPGLAAVAAACVGPAF